MTGFVDALLYLAGNFVKDDTLTQTFFKAIAEIKHDRILQSLSLLCLLWSLLRLLRCGKCRQCIHECIKCCFTWFFLKCFPCIDSGFRCLVVCFEVRNIILDFFNEVSSDSPINFIFFDVIAHTFQELIGFLLFLFSSRICRLLLSRLLSLLLLSGCWLCGLLRSIILCCRLCRSSRLSNWLSGRCRLCLCICCWSSSRLLLCILIVFVETICLIKLSQFHIVNSLNRLSYPGNTRKRVLPVRE